MNTKLKAVLLTLAAVVISVGVWFVFLPRKAPTPELTPPPSSPSAGFISPGLPSPSVPVTPTATPPDTIVLPVMSFPPTPEVTPEPTPTPIAEQVFFDYFGAKLILTGIRSSDKYALILDVRCENSGAYELAIDAVPGSLQLNGQAVKLFPAVGVASPQETVRTGEIAFENLTGEPLPDLSKITELTVTFLMTDMFEMKTLFETVPRTVSIDAK
jgi:hypothetical protein